MRFPEFGDWAVVVALTAVLAWAAISDMRTRRIPNWTVVAALTLFLPWALLHWDSSAAWDLVAGAVALAIGVTLYGFRITGAGDAKLFAAVALFAGLGQLLAFGVATALAGGVIALVSLATRPRRALVMITLRGQGDFGPGIPYGVAIALGGAAVIWSGILNLPIPLSGLS
jgi:prepilin peptidase CpaA